MDLGGFATSWRRLGAHEVREVLSYPQGRAWLEDHPMWMHPSSDPELKEFFRTVLDENDVAHCSELIKRMVNQPNDA